METKNKALEDADPRKKLKETSLKVVGISFAMPYI